MLQAVQGACACPGAPAASRLERALCSGCVRCCCGLCRGIFLSHNACRCRLTPPCRVEGGSPKAASERAASCGMGERDSKCEQVGSCRARGCWRQFGSNFGMVSQQAACLLPCCPAALRSRCIQPVSQRPRGHSPRPALLFPLCSAVLLFGPLLLPQTPLDMDRDEVGEAEDLVEAYWLQVGRF